MNRVIRLGALGEISMPHLESPVRTAGQTPQTTSAYLLAGKFAVRPDLAALLLIRPKRRL
jgi:hypothetical protein